LTETVRNETLAAWTYHSVGTCDEGGDAMRNCKTCRERTPECPDTADGALLALGPFWGGGDRDCPLELAAWRKESAALLGGRPRDE